ncbi:hypothetical protein [Bartonella koehlerae]|uniref:Uncharacterized protein n=1 Tax=Bartonella koehlerae C-29 TaxID=1134510 RepID=A0A067WCR1_9HYPH|nr:hypothetical protein [Bartonella koehlerae]KEC54578.1 hypothetical protein O9A_01192 [Bartonella koehlerae C-29]
MFLSDLKDGNDNIQAVWLVEERENIQIIADMIIIILRGTKRGDKKTKFFLFPIKIITQNGDEHADKVHYLIE